MRSKHRAGIPRDPLSRVSVLTTLALACLVLIGCSGSPGLNRANYDRIRNGHSLAQVENLLGGKGTEVQLTGVMGDAVKDVTQKFGDAVNKQPGMPKELAKEMAGAVGTVTGLVDNFRPKIIQWGDEKTNVQVTFMGGQVVDKKQNGL
jgi:hypothetical protein